jgi:hypothetical protein
MLLKDKTFLMEFIIEIEYLQILNYKVEIQKLEKAFLMEFIIEIEYLQILNYRVEIQKLGNPRTLFFLL